MSVSIDTQNTIPSHHSLSGAAVQAGLLAAAADGDAGAGSDHGDGDGDDAADAEPPKHQSSP